MAALGLGYWTNRLVILGSIESDGISDVPTSKCLNLIILKI